MPTIPEPTGSPEQMPFLRWVRTTLTDMIKANERQANSDQNVNSGQNSTMTMLVNRLGDVTESIAGMFAAATFAASQVTSGIFVDARIPNLDGSKITSGSIQVPGFGAFGAAWSNNLGAVTRQSVWMDASGSLGFAPSSREFKKEIESWSPEEQAVLAMRLVQFRYKDADDHIEVGLIAEELHELGLNWLVAYDVDGSPMSIHYDRISLALLPVIQRLAHDNEDLSGRMNDIEKRLDAMEN